MIHASYQPLSVHRDSCIALWGCRMMEQTCRLMENQVSSKLPLHDYGT